MFRLLAVLSLVFAAALLLPTAAAANTVVVDDDNAQCADADVATIQKAVDKAAKKNSDSATGNDVDLIRVCPGLYIEQVSVPEQVSLPESLVVTIRGEVDTVKAAVADCFASTLTPDPETQAIVAPPSGASTKIFELQADNIDLQGFVLRGQAGASSAAVITDAGHSGYRVYDNLIMGNTVAAFFRSRGVLPSSFNHNCLRDNRWGLANNGLPLVDARIHHNSTFRIEQTAFEQTSACPLCVGMDGVEFDHNVSVEAVVGYFLSFSTSTRVFENTVTSTRIGMRLFGANEAIAIINNRLDVRQTGMARPSGTATMMPPPPNTGALIQGNTITRADDNPVTTGNLAGIGMGADGLRNSQILENDISGFAHGWGISLFAGNTHNTVSGNTITDNGKDGIQVLDGATDNTFKRNSMHGNGTLNPPNLPPIYFDANDANNPINTWINNDCDTDFPVGTICGIP